LIGRISIVFIFQYHFLFNLTEKKPLYHSVFSNFQINKMRNKTGIILLTGALTLLCLYFLSFTFVRNGIMEDAKTFATKSGKYDPLLKQRYIDSLWTKEVYLGNTLKEVTEKAINLGLDLQGGLHVILEVSPAEIINALSGKSADPKFREALALAQKEQVNSQASFVDLFAKNFQQVSGGAKLATIFANAANRGKINSQSSDSQVLKMINDEVNSAIDRSFQVIRTRVDKFGVANPNIQRLPGTSRIQVELPGVENPDRARKLLSAAAKLEFCEVAELGEYAPAMNQIGEILLAEQKATKGGSATTDTTKKTGDLAAQLSGVGAKKDSTKKDTTAAQTAGAALGKYFVQLGNSLGATIKDTAKVNALLRRSDVRSLFPPSYQFAWSVKAITQTSNTGEGVLEMTVVKKNNGRAAIDGDVITDAGQDYDQTGRVEVSMAMNSEGGRKWRTLTAANIGKRVAILLDDYVYSAPTVQNEIPNGRSSITGSFTVEEGKDLANVLKAGKLAAPTRIVEEAFVGPSLGQEAINQGYLSMAIALALVVLIILMYYGNPGNIANVALLFNLFFLVGILVQMGAVMTLPGIAGIVLTMGIAVDANVLINERIREELRQGHPLLDAIRLGYERAWSAIIDGNVSTIIIAVILMIIGTGSVKGFGTTLFWGLLTSVFTSYFVSHLIMDWVMTKRVAQGRASGVTFETALSKGLLQGLNFDFIGYRKKAYITSWTIIAIGLGACLFKMSQGEGFFNLGVDFKGGRTYIVQFAQPQEAAKVREAVMDDFNNSSTEVKTFGTPDKLKITTSYLVEDESEAASHKVRQALTTGLQSVGSNPTVLSESKVGATIADDTLQTSFSAILWSLLAIFAYILIRFRRWQYSLGAVIATLHDALVVLSAVGIVRLFGWSLEVDQVFIAAVLTVIGYSINDTVVVFDRIREFLGPDPDLTQHDVVAKTINASINQTLSRTVMTASTVFLVVTVLLFFGGDILRGFSFAMFIGCLIGTYSSIFVAAPIVVDFGGKKKEGSVSPTTPAVAETSKKKK
jgi:SecD/SecF fusion protein